MRRCARHNQIYMPSLGCLDCNKTDTNVIASNDSDICAVDTELDLIRQDLMHQLKIPDDLDWDYFLETAIRAKEAADVEDRNMVNI